MFSFLRNRRCQMVTLLLLLQAVAFYAYPKAEKKPLGQPLSAIPTEWRDWHMVSESHLDTEVQELLKADETINRTYVDRNGRPISLFIAFFQTQRTGVAPHSPKVCLPGSGWVPISNSRLDIAVPGEPAPIEVNRYVVGKGDYRSLVVYWYQTPYRVMAGEFQAKFFTIVDGIRYLRSDTSLVRVIASANETTLPQAEADVVRFIGDAFPKIKEHLPQQ
jgi:EpsI family protein